MKLILAAAGFVAAVIGPAVGVPNPTSGVDLTALDRSVRPQDDFYRFANGAWLDRTEIPADRVTVSTVTELQERAYDDLHAIILDVAARDGHARGSIEQQVADLYASMMDEETLDALGASPIQDDLDRIAALETREAWAAEVGTLGAEGTGGPFLATIGRDPTDASRVTVELAQGGLMLPDPEYYLSHEFPYPGIRLAYEEYLTRIFRLIDRPDPAAEAKGVVAIETALAEAHWTRSDSRSAMRTSNRFTLADLENDMPGFDWRAWAEPQGVHLVGAVVLVQPSFFRTFASLAATAPLETWKAWLAARHVTVAASFLSPEFGAARFDFFGRLLSGQRTPIPRWKRAVTLISGYLGDALGRMYVERHFPPSSKVRVERIVEHVIEAYREAIVEADWMSDSTRREALQKLSGLGAEIGYPGRWRSYRGLEIEPDDLLGNIERGKRYESQSTVRRVGRGVSSYWEITPQTVNAYYDRSTRKIVFTAAILQPPFFTPEADDAVNYGAIGAVIGHEIGHGFDDQGRRFDSDGELRDWWEPADSAEYGRRARALAVQFSAYRPLPDVPLNGALTLGENLGDLNGLAVAHRAYRRSLGGRRAPVIDGFTGDQRFFIGWAQAWRGKERAAYMRQYLLSNPHTPPDIRVNGPLSNLDAFVAAFDVQQGDGLFRPPADRIRIW